MMMFAKLKDYLDLIRFDKPIGTLLVLWPTLWGLWLASDGRPSLMHLVIFIVGCFLMRSAGCAINDYADRDFDKHVVRTKHRPVTSGRIRPWEALLVTGILALSAFILILPLNTYAKWLSVPALAVAILYPFTKRFFSIPQAILGIAFSFGIPMAYAAVRESIPIEAWLLVCANISWAIAYDTAYAMVDREDDLKLGIKTSAITFGSYDVAIVSLCYTLMMLIFAYIGVELHKGAGFWVLWTMGIFLCAFYIKLISKRQRDDCFFAFKKNNWLGACMFIALAL